MTRGKPLILKPTFAQQERRKDAVVSMTREGYTARQIADALRVSLATVTQDRTARVTQLVGVSRRGRRTDLLPDPDPVDWWSEPAPGPAPPSYVATSPVPRVKALLDYLRDTNALARFSFNVGEAEQAQDERYLVGAQVTLLDTISYLQGLLDVAQDGKAAVEARKPAARDDLRFAEAPLGPNNLPRPLPPKGAGRPPGRIFAYMWSLWWAGHDLEDEQVIAKVASREGNPNLDRIRTAAREMKAALGPPPQRQK